MSPSRSKAIIRPSGLTSTFIHVPSLTLSGTCLRRAPGGALTSHASASRAGWRACASAVVETSRSESAAKLRIMFGKPLQAKSASPARWCTIKAIRAIAISARRAGLRDHLGDALAVVLALGGDQARRIGGAVDTHHFGADRRLARGAAGQHPLGDLGGAQRRRRKPKHPLPMAARQRLAERRDMGALAVGEPRGLRRRGG